MKTIQLTGCENGLLGMKIIGGIDHNGNYTGIFVKKILEGGHVDKTGKVNLGDMIYSVNDCKLTGCSQAEAIQYLRLAAQTGKVKLVIDDSQHAQELFLNLFEPSMDSISNAQSARESTPCDRIDKDYDRNERRSNIDNSKTTIYEAATNLRLGNISIGGSSSKGSGRLCMSADSGILSSPSAPDDFRADCIETICIDHRTTFGVIICGGINDRVNGPNVYIAELVVGGDARNDGNLSVGDLLIAINGESYMGVTSEQANTNLSKLNFGKDIQSYEITFIRKQQLQYSQSFIDKNQQLQRAPSILHQRRELPTITTSTRIANQFFSPSHAVDRSSCKGKTCNMSTKLDKRDDVLLKELVELIEDIQDDSGDEESSDVESEVFTNGVFSPNVMSTPYSARCVRGSSPENTIPHYLKRDVYKENDEEISRKKIKRSTTLALHPKTNLELEKLEGALGHLGLTLSGSQIEDIRKQLHFDADGYVAYGDFVETTKSILGMTTSLAGQSPVKVQSRTFQKSSVEKKVEVKTQENVNGVMSYDNELTRLRRERDEAMQEAEYYRNIVHQKDEDGYMLEDELEQTKHQVAAVQRECSIMRRQTRKVIETHNNSNQNVEKAIRRLEKENSMLRKSNAPMPVSELEDAGKRSVVLGCQLRKSEVSKRTYEVAVDKLTKFVERVHLQLEDNRRDAISAKKQARKQKELSEEAKEVVKSVKMLLEEEPLPFGWEEVYTPDGSKYFMNHVVQTTSWVHPVSRVSRKKNPALPSPMQN